MNVTELLKSVRADETADAVIAALLDLRRKIDKIAVVVEDATGLSAIVCSTSARFWPMNC